MPSVCSWTLGLLLLAAFAPTSHVVAQTANASHQPMEKTISYQGGFTGSQAIDLGDLAGGTDIELLLTVVNNSSDILEVTDVRGSCSCTKVEFNRGEVGTGEAMKVRVLLSVPTQANREARAVPVYVDLANNKQLQLTIRFRIDNLACFQSQTMLFQVRHGESLEKIRIPLVVSSSVSLDDLTLSPEGDFENGSFHFQEQDGTLYAVSDFDLEEFPVGGFSGQLLLHNSATDSSDDIRILIQMMSELELSPEILTLTPKSSGTWKSMGILRLQQKPKTEQDITDLAEHSERKPLAINAKLKDCEVTVSAIPIAEDLYRIKLEIVPIGDSIDVTAFPTELTMNVSSLQKSFVIQRTVRWMNQ